MIQVRGGFAQPPAVLPDPLTLLPSINQQFVRDATDRIKEKGGGSEGSRYLVMRSGDTVKHTFGYPTATGAVVGTSGPGVNLQEEGSEGLPGGVVRPRTGEFLTFRLHQPGDGAEATGRWVRMRQVRIRATHFVRDSVDEALHRLPEFLSTAVQEQGW